VVGSPDGRTSENSVKRLSEKVFGRRSKREFSRQAEHETGQKGTSWNPVGLLHMHLRDFSDSLKAKFAELLFHAVG